MILFLCLSIFMQVAEEPYVVILKDAKRMDVKQAPVFENGRAILELLNGDKVAIPASMVDQEATQTFNETRAKLREEQALLQKLQEAERQAAAEAAKEARKPVILKRAEDMPEFDDSRNTISVVPPASDSEESPELADGVPASGDSPAIAEVPAAAQPYSKSFRSNEPVYVAAERRTPLPEGGYLVECDIRVNKITGAENVVLDYKANFVTAPAESHSVQVTPQKLAYNQMVTVSIRLKTNDELLRTEHGITAEIQD